MERPDWTPEGIDIHKASIARVYDYLLGGSHNFAVDRDMARQIIAAMPDVTTQAAANRAFLRRSVRALLDLGVRQFIDIGSGIPTRGNVHEVARRVDPKTRVVYVDNDPVAVAHSQQILKDDELSGVVQADVRQVSGVINSPAVQRLIDPNEPVGVLMLLLLHAVPDDSDAYGLVEGLRDWSPSGSYLVISHLADETRPEQADGIVQATQTSTTPVRERNRAEVERFFQGYEMIDPGLVWVQAWRPEELSTPFDDGAHSAVLAGVGRRR